MKLGNAGRQVYEVVAIQACVCLQKPALKMTSVLLQLCNKGQYDGLVCHE